MKEIIRSIWIETFQGIDDGNSSHFIETKPDTGILGTIGHLTAEQASKDINGATIARHVHHTMYHINICLSYLEGNQPEADWSVSWNIGAVTEEEWKRIQQEIKEQYNRMLKYIETKDLDDFTLRFFLSSLSHAAYHLGAIRQMVKSL